MHVRKYDIHAPFSYMFLEKFPLLHPDTLSKWQTTVERKIMQSNSIKYSRILDINVLEWKTKLGANKSRWQKMNIRGWNLIIYELDVRLTGYKKRGQCNFKYFFKKPTTNSLLVFLHNKNFPLGRKISFILFGGDIVKLV